MDTAKLLTNIIPQQLDSDLARALRNAGSSYEYVPPNYGLVR